MSEPNVAWQRWLVLIVATAGSALAIYDLPLIWNSMHSAQETFRGLLYDTIASATCIAMFSICLLIAWRAGDSVANLSIALAITAAYISDALWVVMKYHGLEGTVLQNPVNTLTYIAGAGLFLRASQHFPRLITAERTRNPILRVLLRPPALWSVAIMLGVAATQEPWQVVEVAGRLIVLGLGIGYFYVNYRSGDADVRRKVLWFLAAAIAAAVLTVVSLLVKLVLGDDAPETLLTVVGVSLYSLNSLSIFVCIAAAVFYAGAISPSLVIRKTVVYGLTTTLLLFVFATVEVFLHHQIVHFLHVTDTFASSLIGGVFGLTFHPVKHYFEHLLAKVQGRHV
jgi:hypothetical protein